MTTTKTLSSREIRRTEARWSRIMETARKAGNLSMLSTMVRNARQIAEREGLELSQEGQSMLRYYEAEAAA